MSLLLRYEFPNRGNRNHFLSLVAMNVGSSGYGLGLEFEGLEVALERPEASGRLVSHLGERAAGDWRLLNNTVELDMGFIADHRSGFERLRSRLGEVASQFGASG